MKKIYAVMTMLAIVLGTLAGYASTELKNDLKPTPVEGLKAIGVPQTPKKAASESDEWKTIGTATVDDQILTMATYEVEAQENVNTPGYYRLLSVWAEGYDMYLDATDPECVYLPLMDTGCYGFESDVYMYSYSYYCQYYGYTTEEIKASIPDYLITYDAETGIINMPEYSLLFEFPDSEELTEIYFMYGTITVTLPVVSDEPSVVKTWEKCDYALDDITNYDGYRTLVEWSNADYTYEIENAFGENTESLYFNIDANNEINFVGLSEAWGLKYTYYDGTHYSYIYDGEYSYAYVSDDYVYIMYYIYGDAGAGYVYITYPIYGETVYDGQEELFARVAYAPLDGEYDSDDIPMANAVYWDCKLVETTKGAYNYTVYNVFNTGLDDDCLQFNLDEVEPASSEVEPFLVETGNFVFGDLNIESAAGGRKVAVYGDNKTYVYDAEVSNGKWSRYYRYEGGETEGQRIKFRIQKFVGGLDTGYLIITWGSSQLPDGPTSGILSVESAEEAPAVYYNLNGVRVDNPSNGIYIVKQGSKVTKQVIR